MSDTKNTPTLPTEQDNLVSDIQTILNKAELNPAQQQKVMNELIPYLVTRDHKVFDHGYTAAKAGT